MDFEIWMFIRNLMITLFVIAIPLSIMGLVKYTYKRRALAIVNTMPAELRNLLRHPAVCKEASGMQRLKYIKKNIIFGILVFVVLVGFGIFRAIVENRTIDVEVYIGVSLVILAFILVFIIRDILRVAPWSEAYQIRAVTCFATGDGRECFVCYYDFADGDFSAGGIPISRWKKSSIQGGQVVDVLAVIKGNKVKVIDIL
ncbi:MAG: hypothetical protein IJZ44_01300 [Lachnospiraceae bacterium]|nr:hypothetical protein [Lachnospiraceae bacterium]